MDLLYDRDLWICLKESIIYKWVAHDKELLRKRERERGRDKVCLKLSAIEANNMQYTRQFIH